MSRKLVFLAGTFIALLASSAGAQCTGGSQNISWNGWTFSFLRPCLTQSTTGGGNGGGIEIQNARFRGRLVFTKAHTPILNVKYENDACGPYRDWQHQESVMSCANVTAPGRCDGVPITNCENPGGDDIGTFKGVAVVRTPAQLSLITNVQAGWYRYVLKWHFYPDGTFHPEALFGAVPASCVTNPHVHMIYFRVDVDVESSTNAVEERNDYKKEEGTTDYWYSWDPIFLETARMKQNDGSRWWRVVNRSSGRAYLIYPPELFPGGTPPDHDEYGIVPQLGDIWFLKYNSANQEETSDGGSFSRYWAHLNQFITDTSAEFPNDQQQSWDAVVWYAGGTLHEAEAFNPKCHVVQGPYYTPDPKGTAW